MKNRVLFYAPNLANVNVQKFYQIDFDIIQNIGYDLHITDNIIELFKWWKYDIQFIYFYTNGFFRALPAFLFGKKIVFTGGIDSLNKSTETKKRFIIQKIFFWLCYCISSKCIIVSDNDWENIMDVYDRKLVRKLVKSYHAVDVGKFITSIENRKKTFLSVCWQGAEINVKRKGIDKSLFLFNYLIKKPEYSDYNYIIIGKKGAGTEYVESLIRTYGLENKVILMGEVSEDVKIELMKKSEFYFQLSFYEGFGVAALEAMAAGNLIIHSNAGGLKHVVGENGIIVDCHNLENACEEVYHAMLKYDRTRLKTAQLISHSKYNLKKRQDDFIKIFNGLYE